MAYLKENSLSTALKGLEDFCNTERQLTYLKAAIEHGSYTEAAKQCDVKPQTLHEAIKRVKARAASKGFSPDHDMTKIVPEGFGVKGTSTLYGKDGEIKIQWVKTQRDAEEQLQIVEEVITAMCQDVPRLAPVELISKMQDQSIQVLYPIADLHVGMQSWEGETGTSHNLKRIERLLPQAMGALVNAAPASETAVILNTGDFFHCDNMQNRTEASGNPLDVDSRWSRIIRIGVSLMRQCIDLALTKHKFVKVVNVIGNHDTQSSQWLSVALSCLYENEPRVEIVVNPSMFTYHQFGKNLFGFTHGHTVKANDLEMIMAHDCSKLWSDTEHRYWMVGHLHHQKQQEYRNVVVEIFNTLAPGDAWHHGAGYRSNQKLTSIVYHKEHGEVSRNIVNPLMFE